MERLCEIENDCCYDGYSDECNATDSSDEDVEKMLDEYTKGSTKGLTNRNQAVNVENADDNEDDQDDFETEMADQLDASFKSHQNVWLSNMKQAQISADEADNCFGAGRDNFVPDTSALHCHERSELNDEGQECKATDSDDDFYECEKSKLKDFGRSNEDLLYDPVLDKTDQLWVDDQRRIANKNLKLTKSDAILNCPACMSVLCYDCQRHAIYKTQYRAMFVVNCRVSEDEILLVPKECETRQKSKGKPEKKQIEMGVMPSKQDYEQRRLIDSKSVATYDPSDLFKSVRCAKCNTEVAVFDNDEVYHFFNVLSGYV